MTAPVTLAVGEVAQVIADDAKITLNQDEPVGPAKPARVIKASPVGKLILHHSSTGDLLRWRLAAPHALRRQPVLWRLGPRRLAAEAPGWAAADLAEAVSAVVEAEVLVDLAAAAAALAAAAPEEVGSSFSF